MFVNVVAASHGARLSQRDGLSWLLLLRREPKLTPTFWFRASTSLAHVSQWQIKHSSAGKKHTCVCLLFLIALLATSVLFSHCALFCLFLSHDFHFFYHLWAFWDSLWHCFVFIDLWDKNEVSRPVCLLVKQPKSRTLDVNCLFIKKKSIHRFSTSFKFRVKSHWKWLPISLWIKLWFAWEIFNYRESQNVCKNRVHALHLAEWNVAPTVCQQPFSSFPPKSVFWWAWP